MIHPHDAAAAYAQWVAAEIAYQSRLAQVYGERAGDVRYRPGEQDPTTRQLRDAFVAAGREYWRMVHP